MDRNTIQNQLHIIYRNESEQYKYVSIYNSIVHIENKQHSL